MGDRVKNQHYVPRFLLTAFHNGRGGKNPHVWCFDKCKGRCFSTTARNICAERYFNDLGDNQTIEHGLADLEGAYAACHDAVAKAKRLPVGADRVALAHFIAIQHMRTRSVRNTILESSRQAIAEINARKGPDEATFRLPPEMDIEDEEVLKRIHFGLVARIVTRFHEGLLGMKWVLLLNEPRSPFWSSDSPFASLARFPTTRTTALASCAPAQRPTSLSPRQ